MNKKFLSLSSLVLLGVLCLSACGGRQDGKPVTVEDTREDLYVAVLADSDGEVYEETNFKSLYEAAHYVMDNGEKGCYVYTLGDETQRKVFTITGNPTDYWFYYKDGNMLDGYSIYVPGDVEWYRGEKYTRIMSSAGYSATHYQPYYIMGDTEKTESWNRTYYMDAVVRYNPKAFTGIQDTTYTIELSQAKIRPSLSSNTKAIPTVTLSTTDSYNWSNQGIYMDTVTGNWYYVEGEVQSAVKNLEYDTEEVLMTSKWDATKQEFTPNNDVRLSLSVVWDEEGEYTTNVITIEILDKEGKVKKSITKEYEDTQLTMRGTHRANIALDLVPANEEIEETNVVADFMCGAHFNNIVVSEGKGSVREGLTNDEYQGDTDICCTPGQTYDLLYAKGGYLNDSDTGVILDNYACIDYSDINAEKDTWNITFEQTKSEKLRSDLVEQVIELMKLIPEGAGVTDPNFQTAYQLYLELSEPQKLLISEVDGYRQIANILGE